MDRLSDIVVVLQVFIKLLPKDTLDSFLLTLEERLNKHVNSEVDVLGADVVSQVDFGVGLTHTNY
jgi:hypothetical protein